MATPAAPKVTQADLLAGMGPLSGMLTQIPELKGLLSAAVNQQWTAAKFQQAVQNSHWYRTHADTARQVIGQHLADPATYNQSVNQRYQDLLQLSKTQGVHVGGPQLLGLAKQSMLEGWNDNQSLQAIMSHYHGGYYEGQIASQATQLNQLAAEYGNTIPPDRLASWAKQIEMGSASLDQFKMMQQKVAMSTYPGLAEQLKAGMTVKDLAQPYMDQYAKLLELDPATVSLHDRTIQQALQGQVDPATKTHVSQPLWKFQQTVKADPRWQYTDNAKDSVANALHQIGTDFGYGSF